VELVTHTFPFCVKERKRERRKRFSLFTHRKLRTHCGFSSMKFNKLRKGIFAAQLSKTCSILK
jgi:hypothetical protein